MSDKHKPAFPRSGFYSNDGGDGDRAEKIEDAEIPEEAESPPSSIADLDI